METRNLFSDIPSNLPQELAETIVQAEDVRIERIVSRGHCSPAGFWYDQEDNEFVLLLKGSAGILFEGCSREIALQPGDYLCIGRHVRHRVEWTCKDTETVWLAVFYQAEKKE